MDRRAFIGSLVGGVATAAAVRTWPFRVYSFPTEIFSMEKLRRIYVDRALAERGDYASDFFGFKRARRDEAALRTHEAHVALRRNGARRHRRF